MSTARTMMIGTVKLLPSVVGWSIAIVRVAFSPPQCQSDGVCVITFPNVDQSKNHFYLTEISGVPSRKVYLTHQHTSVLDIVVFMVSLYLFSTR